MLSRARKATITGIATAALGMIAGFPDQTRALEEFIGLRVLFGLRGPVTPPPNLVIIAMDRASAEVFGTGADFSEWPRSLPTELLEILNEARVPWIAYDVHFGERPDSSHDQALERAMADADGIVLLDYMTRDEDESRSSVNVVTDKRVRPLPAFSAAADATAPFPLTRRPYLVASYTPFLDSAHGTPVLPVALYAIHAEHAETLLERALEEREQFAAAFAELDLESRMRQMRETLAYQSELTKALRARFGDSGTMLLDEQTRRQLATLLDLYSGPDVRYLNFYGPPRTIDTFPMADVITEGMDPDIDWQRTAVFIGYSDYAPSNRDDTFPTLWSTATGRDLSGVEIAATAFGNLLDGSSLQTFARDWRGLIIVGAFGLALGLAVAPRSASLVLGLLVLASALYLGVAVARLAGANQWWPVAVPLMLQAPAALFMAMFMSYRQERIRQDALSRGASLYLPPGLIDRIAADPATNTRTSELISGTCMVTDVEGFTEFSERTSPRALEQALNAYYEKLYQIVQRNGGLVTDIVGDSGVAIWRLTPSGTAPEGAIAAAQHAGIELGRSSDQFPRTRIGIHAGEFVLGAVGADEHLEYRAVGDVVNSAARIQALNKILGTTILATQEALGPLQPEYRFLGRFQLAGKAERLNIWQILAGHEMDTLDGSARSRFDAGLDAFRSGDWRTAQTLFASVLEQCPGDGPSLYFARVIVASAERAPPADWDGVIRIGS